LTKKDMKPRPMPCFFSKSLLVLLAECHDRAHVHLVEGGEHGGGVLGLDQAGGDALTHGRHLFTACAAGSGSGGSGSGGRRSGPVLVGLDEGEHILFADATTRAGPRDGAQVDMVVFGEFAGEGRGLVVTTAVTRGRAGRFRDRGRSRGGLALRLGGGLGVRRLGCRGLGLGGRAVAARGLGRGLIDGANGGTHGDLVAGLGPVADDTGGRGGDLHGHLVGLEFQHGLVALDPVTVLDGPGGDDA
jgi:hypothetical protein